MQKKIKLTSYIFLKSVNINFILNNLYCIYKISVPRYTIFVVFIKTIGSDIKESFPFILEIRRQTKSWGTT